MDCQGFPLYPLTLVSHSAEDATFLTISEIALGYRSLSFYSPMIKIVWWGTLEFVCLREESIS
jgi:hypothetical protein